MTIGAGTADGIPWTVRLIPTDQGACTNLESDHEPQPYGVRIRGTSLLGISCGPTPATSGSPLLQLDLLRNGAQIVSGAVPAGTTSATVHDGDGSTTEITPDHGGIAFAVVGNRVATEVVPHVPDTTWRCALEASFSEYRCSAGSIGPPPNPFGGSPGTAPGQGNR